ncbi:MAG: DUF1877 family protein [Candidatus Hydrogenedentes bacterium]|nr:DUF1877 family protein [Candidatus Hydrogenedentota bacterium]
MACLGVYFALTDDDSEKLLAATSDREVVELIQEDIEERWDADWLLQIDKAWDALHRCLTDGTLTARGTVRSKCVLGGRQLHRGGDYTISFLDAGEVKEAYEALRPIDETWFRQQYFALKKKFLWFDISDYEGEIGEEDFDYTWTAFLDTRAFFHKAAQANRPIVFTVDH